MTGVTVFFWVLETIAARHRFGRWDKYLIWLRLKQRLLRPEVDEEMGNYNMTDDCSKEQVRAEVREDAVHSLDAPEEEQKNAKPTLAWEVGSTLPIVVLYTAPRVYMIVEVFLSLRELPLGAYNTVNIGQILPHW